MSFSLFLLSHFQTPCLYSWVRSPFTSLVYTPALTESFDLAAYSRSLVFSFFFSFRLLADASMTSELSEALLFFSFFFLSSFFSLDVFLSFFGGSLELPAFPFLSSFHHRPNLSLPLAHLLLDLSIHSSKSFSPYPMLGLVLSLPESLKPFTNTSL